jgi:hypothetical protein
MRCDPRRLRRILRNAVLVLPLLTGVAAGQEGDTVALSLEELTGAWILEAADTTNPAELGAPGWNLGESQRLDLLPEEIPQGVIERLSARTDFGLPFDSVRGQDCTPGDPEDCAPFSTRRVRFQVELAGRTSVSVALPGRAEFLSGSGEPLDFSFLREGPSELVVTHQLEESACPGGRECWIVAGATATVTAFELIFELPEPPSRLAGVAALASLALLRRRAGGSARFHEGLSATR